MFEIQDESIAKSATLETRNRLAADNLRLVWSVAYQIPRSQRAGLGVEDLAAEGMLGLLEAAAGFDPERDNRFSTYAVWCIRGRIRSCLRRERRQTARASATLGESVPAANDDECDADGDWLPKALERLQPDDALLVKLRFGIGQPELSFDELGRQLGVSREGARQRVHRAVERLRLIRAAQLRERLSMTL